MSTKTFGDLRSLLQEKSSPKTFKKVLRLLEELSDDPSFEDAILPYAEDSLKTWDVMHRSVSSTSRYDKRIAAALIKVQKLESWQGFQALCEGKIFSEPEVLILSGYGLHNHPTPDCSHVRHTYPSVRALVLHNVENLPVQSLPSQKMFPHVQTVYHIGTPQRRNDRWEHLYYGFVSACKADLEYKYHPSLLKRTDGPTKAVRAYYSEKMI